MILGRIQRSRGSEHDRISLPVFFNINLWFLKVQGGEGGRGV